MEKTCFTLAYLTSQGRVPLLGLNDIIAGVLRGWSSRRVGWLLLQTFYQCRLATGSNTGTKTVKENPACIEPCLPQWQHFLMGLLGGTKVENFHVSTLIDRVIGRTGQSVFSSLCFFVCMQHTTCVSYLSMSSSVCWAGLFLFVGVLKRMEWLLELMGHIRNVAYGATPVICGDTKLVCFCLPGTHSPAVCCRRWLTCWKLCFST